MSDEFSELSNGQHPSRLVKQHFLAIIVSENWLQDVLSKLVLTIKEASTVFQSNV